MWAVLLLLGSWTPNVTDPGQSGRRDLTEVLVVPSQVHFFESHTSWTCVFQSETLEFTVNGRLMGPSRWMLSRPEEAPRGQVPQRPPC